MTRPPRRPDDAPDVIIVGGGIGGLSAAFALTRKGVSVRVLERSAEFAEVGAGLQLAPNCTRILGDYGLLDEAKRLGVLPTSMVMKDALDGSVLTSLDLKHLERRYGSPYLVMHRSDLHGLFLGPAAGRRRPAPQPARPSTRTPNRAPSQPADGAEPPRAAVAAAACTPPPANSSSATSRSTPPSSPTEARSRSRRSARTTSPRPTSSSTSAIAASSSVRWRRRDVQPVAGFESAKARRGEQDWGTPDELDAAFAHTTENVQLGLPLMWRDRWWRMFDRDPIGTWVYGRIALLGDAAHPPLQYIAQGAIMAIEDGYVLAEHLAATRDPDRALAAYQAVRAPADTIPSRHDPAPRPAHGYALPAAPSAPAVRSFPAPHSYRR